MLKIAELQPEGAPTGVVGSGAGDVAPTDVWHLLGEARLPPVGPEDDSLHRLAFPLAAQPPVRARIPTLMKCYYFFGRGNSFRTAHRLVEAAVARHDEHRAPDRVRRASDGAPVMLRRLAGLRHEVLTACRVRHGEHVVERVVSTFVTFRSLDAGEVTAHLAFGEWRGKADAYAIQGIVDSCVTEMRGSFTNVVGLPVGGLRALEALPDYPPSAFGVVS